MSAGARERRVGRLRRARPKRRFARWSGYGLIALAGWAWIGGGFLTGQAFTSRRLESLRRFLGELVPFELRGAGLSLEGLADWARALWVDRGFEALVATLAISVVAIVLAAGLGALLTLPAVRTLATVEPFFMPLGRRNAPWRHAWRLLVAGTRLVLTFLRSIPEYLWVFLLIGMLGPTPWPAILALALHNAGILGRLNAEVIEDLDPAPFAALRAAGASRLQIAGWGVAPIALPRLLLFFFYRWESCVRESTALGLLGIVSIGFWIQDARARQQPDTMLFFILLGAALVLVGDLVSGIARRWVREAR